jgi:hypothetical protein
MSRACKYSFLVWAIGFLQAWADSWGPPRNLEVLNTQTGHKFTISPPRFKNDLSYDLYKEENFLALAAAEGLGVETNLTTTIRYYYDYSGNHKYSLGWTRPLNSSVIPTKAISLTVNKHPILILQGNYRQVDENVHFFVFDSYGKQMTNGFISDVSKSSWQIEGDQLVFRNAATTQVKISIKQANP